MSKPTDSTQRHCEAEGRMEGACSSSLSVAVLAVSANVNSSVLAKKVAYPWSKACFRKQSAQRRYGCRSSNQSKIFVVRSCVGSDLHGSNQAGSERACLHPIMYLCVHRKRARNWNGTISCHDKEWHTGLQMDRSGPPSGDGPKG